MNSYVFLFSLEGGGSDLFYELRVIYKGVSVALVSLNSIIASFFPVIGWVVFMPLKILVNAFIPESVTVSIMKDGVVMVANNEI